MRACDRASRCAKRDETVPWRGGGVTRDEARLISQIDGAPAYGGTPSDAGVLRAIAELRGRGLKVTLYPFLMMDVPDGNGLPDPYGGAEQSPYPGAADDARSGTGSQRLG